MAVTSDICLNVRQSTYEKVIFKATPGPDAYYVDRKPITLNSLHPEHPHYSIGNSLRRSLAPDSYTPGPDEHQNPLNRSTLTQRQVDSKIRDIKNFKFGTGRRMEGTFDQGQSPGPAAYEVHNTTLKTIKNSPRAVFGRDLRKDLNNGVAGPSPADYHIGGGFGVQLSSEKATSPRARVGNSPRQFEYSSVSPGPAAYRPENNMGTVKSRAAVAAIGNDRRKDLTHGGPNSPGPAAYTTVVDPLSTKRAAPRAKMGHSPRKDVTLMTEGAGVYYGPDNFTRGLSTQNDYRSTIAHSPRQPMGRAERFRYPTEQQLPPSPVAYGYTFRADDAKAPGWTMRAR